MKQNYAGFNFLATVYCINTFVLDEEKISKYILERIFHIPSYIQNDSKVARSIFRRRIYRTKPLMSTQIEFECSLASSFLQSVINKSLVKQIPQFGEIREATDESSEFIFMKK